MNNNEAKHLPSDVEQVLDTYFKSADTVTIPTVRPQNIHTQELQELTYNMSHDSNCPTNNQEGRLKLNNDEGESLTLPTTADTTLNFVSDAIFNGCKFDLR